MQGKAGGCNLNNCSLLKGTLEQGFSWRFSKSFKTPLKRLQLQKSICSGFFNSIIGCRMNCYNFIKRELLLHTIFWIFSKVFGQQSQSTLVKVSVMKFKRVLGCRLQFCSYQNVTAAEIISSKFWRWDYPHKNPLSLSLSPVLVVTYNISKKKIVRRHCPSSYRRKC